MKITLKTKYDQYGAKEGVWQEGESMTDTSQAEDSEIYSCIEKYGIQSLMRQSKANEEYLNYRDNREDMTLDEAVRYKEEMGEYFKQMPARARKVFGDNPDIFYEKYKRGEFDQLMETGAMTPEQAYILSGGEEKYNLPIYQEVANDVITVKEKIQNEERLEENNNTNVTDNQ